MMTLNGLPYIVIAFGKQAIPDDVVMLSAIQGIRPESAFAEMSDCVRARMAVLS